KSTNSSVTPVLHYSRGRCSTEDADSGGRENCYTALHHEPQTGVTAQVVDMPCIIPSVTPVTPVTPPQGDAPTSQENFFAGIRSPPREPPGRHQWHQEGRRATCLRCRFDVPALLRKDDR